MGVQLNILTICIELGHDLTNILPPFIGSAHVHKKDMLGSKFIANGSHLPDTGCAFFVFTPHETPDMIRDGTLGKGLGING